MKRKLLTFEEAFGRLLAERDRLRKDVGAYRREELLDNINQWLYTLEAAEAYLTGETNEERAP